jgi:hypothetical protein
LTPASWEEMQEIAQKGKKKKNQQLPSSNG